MQKVLTGILIITVFFLTLYFKEYVTRWDGGFLSASLLLFCFVILSFPVHFFLHEGGHLVAGLCSGYGFSSFRVFRVQLVKQNGRIRLKRFHIPGTGGQCLMSPPRPYRENFPVTLYHLGGGLGNAFALLVVLGIYAVSPGKDPAFGMFAAAFSFTGLMVVWMNLVPRQVTGIGNDGWNVQYFRKDREARFGLWLALEINDRLTQGQRISRMPAEWFEREIAGEESLDNAITSGGAIYRLARLLDLHRFPEALDMAEELLKPRRNLIPIYRMELLCDSAFLSLLLGRDAGTALSRITSDQLKKYRRATRGYPARQRLDYTIARLWDRDDKAAARALAGFEKACRYYPYEGEIASERELMELVKQKADALDPKGESQ